MDMDQRAERPPSSYGSMKSDEESVIEFTENDELALPAITSQAITGVKLNCVDYPETIFTQTTQQTKPPGADVFDTRYFDDLEEVEELDEPEDMEDYDVPDSPEPPPPVEPDGPQMEEEESSQPGRLHPELCMPYLFKTMQTVLAELSHQQLKVFVSNTISASREVADMLDVLDVVDRMIEDKGHEEAVGKTVETLEYMKLDKQAKDLLRKCIKSRTRCRLRNDVERMFKIIREGVPQAGKQEFLKEIYVEAALSTQGHGGIDPWHEYRPYPGHPPLPLPPVYTLITVNNLFRQKNKAGQPVRVATTTGLPGSGKTVLTRKFMLDWADEKANRDFQFVIPLSFRLLQRMRDKEDMSFMAVLLWDLRLFKNLDCLMEPDCKFLIIMDGFDEWKQPIDWNDSRKITNINEMAHLDVVVVNLLRGTLLPHARLWILGRRAALSQLPPNLVDLETEIQGFSTENTEQFLRQKFRRNPELRDQVLTHYKRCASLIKFCRLPINSWIVYTLMESRYQYLHYGKFAPKLSEFTANYMIFEFNNYLQSHLRQQSNQINWREEDRAFLKKLGKLALKLQDKNAWLFSEEDIKEAGLDVKMVTTFCGLCTEVSKEQRQGRKKYCFVHLILQEYMAVLWVFLTFWLDGKNLLVHHRLSLWPRPQPKMFASKNDDKVEEKSILPLIESAVTKYLGSPPGRYDMMMRHFCGISHSKHISMMTGRFCPNRNPLMKGQEDAAKLLEQKILSHPDRAAVLRVCISELTEVEY